MVDLYRQLYTGAISFSGDKSTLCYTSKNHKWTLFPPPVAHTGSVGCQERPPPVFIWHETGIWPKKDKANTEFFPQLQGQLKTRLVYYPSMLAVWYVNCDEKEHFFHRLLRRTACELQANSDYHELDCTNEHCFLFLEAVVITAGNLKLAL